MGTTGKSNIPKPKVTKKPRPITEAEQLQLAMEQMQAQKAHVDYLNQEAIKLRQAQRDREEATGIPSLTRAAKVGYDIAKVFDTTGITSIPDWYNSWTDGKFDYHDITDPLSAIPIIGKETEGVINLSKTNGLPGIYSQLTRAGKLRKAQRALNIGIGVDDVLSDLQPPAISTDPLFNQDGTPYEGYKKGGMKKKKYDTGGPHFGFQPSTLQNINNANPWLNPWQTVNPNSPEVMNQIYQPVENVYAEAPKISDAATDPTKNLPEISQTSKGVFGTTPNMPYIFGSQMVQSLVNGIASRSKNSRSSAQQRFNEEQFNPLNYLARNPNTSKQDLYGMKSGGTLSPEKAAQMLKDGTANGKPLTDKQKRYFGMIASGQMADGGLFGEDDEDNSVYDFLFGDEAAAATGSNLPVDQKSGRQLRAEKAAAQEAQDAEQALADNNMYNSIMAPLVKQWEDATAASYAGSGTNDYTGTYSGPTLGKGLDVSGDPTKMKELYTFAKQQYGVGDKLQGINEMAWNPMGVYDNGTFQPGKTWKGHDNHIHFGFEDPNVALSIIDYSKRLGLRASENPAVDKVNPVHTKGSFHYQHFAEGGTFGQAFAAARKEKGAGQVFPWNGKLYSTNYAEEEITQPPRPQGTPTAAPAMDKEERRRMLLATAAQAPSGETPYNPFTNPKYTRKDLKATATKPKETKSAQETKKIISKTPDEVLQKYATAPQPKQPAAGRTNAVVVPRNDNHFIPLTPQDNYVIENGVIVDKRTGRATIVKDHKSMYQFPVLTGQNVNSDVPNLFTAQEIENRPEARTTPQGTYQMTPNPEIYGKRGFNLINPALSANVAVHTTYDPKTRNPYYGSLDPRARNASYGCVNCQPDDIDSLYKYFPQGAQMVVTDSRNPSTAITAPRNAVTANSLLAGLGLGVSAPKAKVSASKTRYEDGGIHINPENRGKFNATKQRTGKTTEELTHSSDPLTRKRAIFAQNAAKWHHQDGGEIPTFDEYYNTIPLEKNYMGDYDLRTAYNELPYELMNQFATSNDAHLPDTYKLPNHPTFSNESMYYNGQTPGVGGYWGDNDQFIRNPQVGPPVPPMLNQYKGGGAKTSTTNNPVNPEQLYRQWAMDRIKENQNFHEGWLNSPMYKKMARASYAKDDPEIGYLLADDYTDIRRRGLRQANYSLDNLTGTTLGTYNKNKQSIKFDTKIDPYGDTINHEQSHASDMAGAFIPKSDISLMNSYRIQEGRGDEFYDYVAEPTETRARLNSVRKFAKDHKIYDPYTQTIDEFKFNELQQAMMKDMHSGTGTTMLDLLQTYGSENTMRMLNTISKNTNANDPTKGYAKKGGKVEPIYVNSKNDPRYKSYQDSLTMYNMGEDWVSGYYDRSYGIPYREGVSKGKYSLPTKFGPPSNADIHDYSLQDYKKEIKDKNSTLNSMATYDESLNKILKTSQKTGISPYGLYPTEGIIPAFKKPIQPVKVNRNSIPSNLSLAGMANTPYTMPVPQAVPMPAFTNPYLAPEPSATGPDKFQYWEGMNAPGYAFKKGGEYDMDALEVDRLRKLGYKIEIL